MKTKIDFVTNSSSSSFVAWGVYFDEDEIGIEDIEEKIYNKKVPLTIYDREGQRIIGVHPTKMELTETLQNFLNRVKIYLEEIEIDMSDKTIQFYEEGWYDG